MPSDWLACLVQSYPLNIIGFPHTWIENDSVEYSDAQTSPEH